MMVTIVCPPGVPCPHSGTQKYLARELISFASAIEAKALMKVMMSTTCFREAEGRLLNIPA